MKRRLFSLALVACLGAQFFAVSDLQAARKRSGKQAAAHRAPRAAAAGDQLAPVAAAVDPRNPPQVRAQSVLVFDPFTGHILCEKNPDVRRPVASTQKLLTALIVAEAGALDDAVTVERADTQCEPTKLDFRTGDVYTRRDLLAALLVHSCNDVARCLARDNAGSYEQFADKMNARVAELGGRDSHFVNPNGLPTPGQSQFSTARDMARIAKAVYFNSLLRNMVNIPRLTFRMYDGSLHEYTNTNKVLIRYPLCNGMKTGYTVAAGHCLVSSATTGTRTVICVALGDNKSIWNDSQSLLSWGLIAEQTTGDNQL